MVPLIATLLLSCVIFIVQTTEAKVKLSQLIDICDANDPKLNQCVMTSTNKLVPQTKIGIRDLDIPGLDPLNVPLMVIGQESGSVNMKLQLINTKHTGISGSIIDYVDMDVGNMIWKLGYRTPQYTIVGDYKATGKILILPITGGGRVNFTINDSYSYITLYGKKKRVNDKVYFDLVEMAFNITTIPGHNFLVAEPTEGPERLAQTMRVFMRENADAIIDSVRDTLDAVYREIITSILRRTFNKIPYNELIKNA